MTNRDTEYNILSIKYERGDLHTRKYKMGKYSVKQKYMAISTTRCIM